MSKSAVAVMGFVTIAILALSLILIYQFGFTSAASTDIGVNLSGTSYQTAYNYSGNTTRVAFSMFSYVPYLLGVLALLSTLFLMFAVAKNR